MFVELLVQVPVAFHELVPLAFHCAGPGRAIVSLPLTAPLVAVIVALPAANGGD